MRIIVVALRVADQDRALRFYTDVLGFTVTEDMDLGPMRWLTVAPPDDPDTHVLLERLRPPVIDQETADQMDTLLAKGYGSTLFLEVDDIHATFERVVAKGAEVVQEPAERFYGIDAAIRDDSGNQIRMTQRVETGILPPNQGGPGF